MSDPHTPPPANSARSPEPCPALGIDLDGTLDIAPTFFSHLTHVWPGKVYVITFRSDEAKAVREIERLGVRCDGVFLVNSFPEKAAVIARLGIRVFWDDMDEVLAHVAEDVAVFKVRNGGNFDFDDRKWLYDDRTGRTL